MPQRKRASLLILEFYQISITVLWRVAHKPLSILSYAPSVKQGSYKVISAAPGSACMTMVILQMNVSYGSFDLMILQQFCQPLQKNYHIDCWEVPQAVLKPGLLKVGNAREKSPRNSSWESGF